MIYLRSARDAAAATALVAVDAITSAAMLASEVVVVVGSTVANLLEEWADR
jgi:hypothetical protein